MIQFSEDNLFFFAKNRQLYPKKKIMQTKLKAFQLHFLTWIKHESVYKKLSNLELFRNCKILCVMCCAIWYHLYNLKNVKKLPWRSVAKSLQLY